MEDTVQVYIVLFILFVIIGQIFDKTMLPVSLVYVIAGILLSFIPFFQRVNFTLNPSLVLNILLPLLIYQISSFASWQEMKKNIRPIALLSIGHVLFITFLVAIIIHTLIPAFNWPLAIVLGAVISPPDDVAIVAVAEKIRMPHRVVTILEGEAMLNDATALIVFRFALVALATQNFSTIHAIGYFIVALIGEGLYGLLVGFVMGELRLRIQNPNLHIIASLITPFIAYFPAEMMGSSGILSTVAAGFVIGHFYAVRFTPEFRLFSLALWPAISFSIKNVLFLLVGLNMVMLLSNLSTISNHELLFYGSTVVLTVVIGRFVWVYGAMIYLPWFILRLFGKKSRWLPWQYPFIVSWAGMRGAISLAAALAVPALPMIDGINPRALLVFLVVCVIGITLLAQGLSLPWLVKIIGMKKYGQQEEYDEHLNEIAARIDMTRATLRWLYHYKKKNNDNPVLLEQVKLYIREYRIQKKQLLDSLENHEHLVEHDQYAELKNEVFLLSQIVEVERQRLLQLWHNETITLATRNKLLQRLDHRIGHLTG